MNHLTVLVFCRQDNFAVFYFVLPEERLQSQVKETLMTKSQINHTNPCS